MAVRSLNKAQLIGNLTRDPELRYTPKGTAVCTFGMATNRSWVTDTGDKKEEAEFHRIVAWNKLAELCAQLLFKGRKVFVEGRLQTRQWTAQDGTPRQTTEIVISDMIILDSKRSADEEAEEVTPEESAEMKSEPVAEEEGLAPASVERKGKPADKSQSKPAAAKPATKADDQKKAKKSSATEIQAEDIPF
jgi:single-strand DNA-binding protein